MRRRLGTAILVALLAASLAFSANAAIKFDGKASNLEWDDEEHLILFFSEQESANELSQGHFYYIADYKNDSLTIAVKAMGKDLTAESGAGLRMDIDGFGRVEICFNKLEYDGELVHVAESAMLSRDDGMTVGAWFNIEAELLLKAPLPDSLELQLRFLDQNGEPSRSFTVVIENPAAATTTSEKTTTTKASTTKKPTTTKTTKPASAQTTTAAATTAAATTTAVTRQTGTTSSVPTTSSVRAIGGTSGSSQAQTSSTTAASTVTSSGSAGTSSQATASTRGGAGVTAATAQTRGEVTQGTTANAEQENVQGTSEAQTATASPGRNNIFRYLAFGGAGLLLLAAAFVGIFVRKREEEDKAEED
ncbi:MAG: hypothetical protein LBQ80_03490 [Clostridium sp.]|jgi:hypothetical protein|nr:hypothetical protein [Clostridium sp.]